MIFYIITPISIFILYFLIGILTPIVFIPLTALIMRIENNPEMYRFRTDMVLQGIFKGIVIVLIIKYMLFSFNSKMSPTWISAYFLLQSAIILLTWNRENPIKYEFSFNISPIIGFAIGLYLI